MARVTRGAMLVLLAGALAACGDEGSGSTEHHSGAGGGDGVGGHMAMDEMSMGDPDAVPAGDIPGAALAGGQFQLLDTAPEGYQDVAGTATMARHDGGTTVTLELSGLQPDTEFSSHVHEGRCAEGGGEHYKFDPAGGDLPPNEIHLTFTSTADGTGFMTAENDRRAGPQARSVVVHPREFADNRVACAPLS